jgi:hypothetical protein
MFLQLNNTATNKIKTAPEIWAPFFIERGLFILGDSSLVIPNEAKRNEESRFHFEYFFLKSAQ